MELGASRNTATCAAIQELLSILLSPKVHYRVHKSPLMLPILSQINPVHNTSFYLSKIRINIIHPHVS
jgi:hypothetical protein